MNRKARVIRPFQTMALVLPFWSYHLNHFSMCQETLRQPYKNIISGFLKNFISYTILCSEIQNTFFFKICTLSIALFQEDSCSWYVGTFLIFNTTARHKQLQNVWLNCGGRSRSYSGKATVLIGYLIYTTQQCCKFHSSSLTVLL